ncbi:hypothetical protein [Roseixanthobacter glucoisosaccharinicivorans]|uniref:hypothetical protein n=1 Tax=Roseixanthobacter glucoisosaccharinicivorans TaxID=3119923 RepID=UPI00372A4C64
MDDIPHTRRVLGNQSMGAVEPHSLEVRDIIILERADSAALIAELVEALELAEVALAHSEPTMKHYGEPVERHSHAAKMVRATLSKAKGE